MDDMAYIVSRTLENKIALAEHNNQNAMLVTLDVLKEILSLLKEQDGLAKAVEQEHRVNEYLNKQLANRPEIVRCKDCKRYYANGGTCDQVLTDWFCADGKRKRRGYVKPVRGSATDWDGIECE